MIAWGHVALMGHNHAVQHPTGGQVADLWVKEGDIVQMGAPLLRLDGAQTATQGAVEGTVKGVVLSPINLIRDAGNGIKTRVQGEEEVPVAE